MFPNARSNPWGVDRLKVLIACCGLVPLLAHGQYVGGMGRGTVQSGCEPRDCEGDPGGPALPGTICNDGDSCTVDDLYTSNCACAGTFQDSDGDGACDAEDGCPTDSTKTEPGCCGCGFPDVLATWYADADHDGEGDPALPQQGIACDTLLFDQFTCDPLPTYVSNNDDLCPILMDTVPGDPCDDGIACTVNDSITVNCACIGVATNSATIFGNSILADGLAYYFSTSVLPGAVYDWSILPDSVGWFLDEQGTTVLVVAPPINELVQLCVSATVPDSCLYACMDLYVMDVGVQEASGSGLGFAIRPNPSDGRFELVRSDPLKGPVSITVEDATGREVWRSPPINARSTMVDLGDAPAGIYLLRVQNDHGGEALRLVVQR